VSLVSIKIPERCQLENIVSRAILNASAEFVSGEQVIIRPAHPGGDFSAGTTPTHLNSLPSPTTIPPGHRLREAAKNVQEQVMRENIPDSETK
jgi:hypothetical protein